MSSVTVLCPNGHRVKVTTNPNMSLQAVLETAASKKGFEPSEHILEFHKKRLDMSSTIRFSGLPNNATIEMEKLSEDELERQSQQEVSVCLQLPSGERIMGSFTTSSSLGSVLDSMGEKLGAPGEGEEPVLVYMRREVVGRDEMERLTLRTLGLIQGKGLFRFFYKKPEDLKVQANVYEVKEREKVAPAEIRHVPMRLDADNTKDETPPAATPSTESKNDCDDKMDCDTNTEDKEEDSTPSTVSKYETNISREKDKSPAVTGLQNASQPDSTQPDPIINYVGPNNAIIFSSTDVNSSYQDIDDDFFDLSLDEVKTMYKDLRQEVKKLTEGDMLMTKEMKAAQREADKLTLLSKYKSCVLRIQFPSRHVVQGIFGPDTKISAVLSWLGPVLCCPLSPQELYTAPPRTSLPPDASLMELGLFPAALVHWASLVTRTETTGHLTEEAVTSLSNITGANTAASQARRRMGAENVRTVGDTGVMEAGPSRLGKRSIESIPEETNVPRISQSSKVERSDGSKVPKWFKPSKK